MSRGPYAGRKAHRSPKVQPVPRQNARLSVRKWDKTVSEMGALNPERTQAIFDAFETAEPHPGYFRSGRSRL